MQTSILFSNEMHWRVALGTRRNKLGKGQEYLGKLRLEETSRAHLVQAPA